MKFAITKEFLQLNTENGEALKCALFKPFKILR